MTEGKVKKKKETSRPLTGLRSGGHQALEVGVCVFGDKEIGSKDIDGAVRSRNLLPSPNDWHLPLFHPG